MQTLPQYLAETGQTQAEFAAKVPTTQVTVWRWCSGASHPAREHIQRIDEITAGAVPPAVWFQTRAAE